MNRTLTINLSLLVLISLFLHLIVMTSAVMPEFSGRKLMEALVERAEGTPEAKKQGRDRLVKVKVAENINPNLKRNVNRNTMISDKDSTEQGHLDNSKEASWYSETTDMRLMKKGKGKSTGSGEGDGRRALQETVPDDFQGLMVYLNRPGAGGGAKGGEGMFNEFRLPQPNRMSRLNSLFFSNSGLFSLNTVEFRHFRFAKQIVDRISSNWYPPVMANAQIGGYAPGGLRIMAIPPQEVKAYFVINANGDVVKSGILDSGGNRTLDDSCLESIRLAGNFGPVPDDLKKKMRNGVLTIPFIFGYGR
jgi:hypothetical protein